MKKFVLLISMFVMVCSCNLMAKKIIGVVISEETANPIGKVKVMIKSHPAVYAFTNANGKYSIEASSNDVLVFTHNNYSPLEVVVGSQSFINVSMKPLLKIVECEEEADVDMVMKCETTSARKCKEKKFGRMNKMACGSAMMGQPYRFPQEPANREGYSTIHENGFKVAMNDPLSTFSIDVDAASYSNIRRFLNEGRKPVKDAVRIEEMINYFSYDYPQPDNGHPFAIYKEVGECPWNQDHLLVHVGLQGEKIAMENLPPSNIVFLIDVSGSMMSPNKLPLLKKAFKLLVKQLRSQDRVAMVVYAGSSGLVLPSTSCDNKQKILEALENLQAGGSTAGAAGLRLAYKVASKHFMKKGNNRIILATDGDFNVGISSNAEMERLIEKEREKGIFMSVLGFGTGNYMDDKMEIIADKGNGNYAYIDNILEAKKVLVNEFGGTLFTIAKDVKIQIEFNPAVVAEYRLIGYENRLLNDEDFEDDKKDAGELGSGHTVTALYEVVLAGDESASSNTLKYQTANLNDFAKKGSELATVKFRYKKPDGHKSILLEEIIANKPLKENRLSDNFIFSAAVAEFGMLLRGSDHKGCATFADVINMAQKSKGNDKEGYRSEFIQLVKLSEHL